jgi:hypothetical protein
LFWYNVFVLVLYYHFSAHQHINTSAHQHISTSTHQHINTSAHQQTNRPTDRHPPPIPGKAQQPAIIPSRTQQISQMPPLNF